MRMIENEKREHAEWIENGIKYFAIALTPEESDARLRSEYCRAIESGKDLVPYISAEQQAKATKGL